MAASKLQPPRHEPVLVEEVLSFVPDTGVLVDGTVGDGGHFAHLLAVAAKRQPRRVIGIDRDPVSLARARQFLPKASPLDLRSGSYADLATILSPAEFSATRFVLLDLGYSSAQVDDEARGFSFQTTGRLDMRYNQDDLSIPTAAEVIQQKSQTDLADILWQYGEERLSRKIARLIAAQRERHRITTTAELAAICERAYGRTKERIHPATRTFQALRIFINQELSEIKYFVESVLPDLPAGCVVAIISFHSLEDRIVKRGFRALAKPGRNEFAEPIVPTAELLHKKVIKPGEAERARNPRSRSAKLRVLRRI